MLCKHTTKLDLSWFLLLTLLQCYILFFSDVAMLHTFFFHSDVAMLHTSICRSTEFIITLLVSFSYDATCVVFFFINSC
jgi:hypothetical protein